MSAASQAGDAMRPSSTFASSRPTKATGGRAAGAGLLRGGDRGPRRASGRSRSPHEHLALAKAAPRRRRRAHRDRRGVATRAARRPRARPRPPAHRPRARDRPARVLADRPAPRVRRASARRPQLPARSPRARSRRPRGSALANLPLTKERGPHRVGARRSGRRDRADPPRAPCRQPRFRSPSRSSAGSSSPAAAAPWTLTASLRHPAAQARLRERWSRFPRSGRSRRCGPTSTPTRAATGCARCSTGLRGEAGDVLVRDGEVLALDAAVDRRPRAVRGGGARARWPSGEPSPHSPSLSRAPRSRGTAATSCPTTPTRSGPQPARDRARRTVFELLELCTDVATASAATSTRRAGRSSARSTSHPTTTGGTCARPRPSSPRVDEAPRSRCCAGPAESSPPRGSTSRGALDELERELTSASAA